MIIYRSSEHMTEIEDSSIQAVITSPPYPMIKKWDKCFEKQNIMIYTGMHLLLKRVWEECYRILQDGSIMCVNIGDATRSIKGEFCCYPNYALTVSICYNIGFTPLVPIFWHKISNRPNAFLGSGFLPCNAYVSQDCEYIAILRKGGKRVFTDEEKERRKSSVLTKEERDLYYQQLWNIPGKRNAAKYSSWPGEIPYRLMRMFTIIGDTIVDPFCGAETGEVYEENGRKFIGYNIGD